MEQPDLRISLRRLARAAAYLRPDKLSVIGIVTLALLIAGFAGLEPLLLKYVFDHLGSPDAKSALTLGVVGLVGFGLVREVSNGFSNWLTWKTRIGVQYRLLEATVDRLHRLPLSYHRGEAVGSTMTRLDRGIQGLVGALSELAFNVVPTLVYLVVAVVVMLRLEWRLALLVMALAPLPALIAAFAAPRQTRREKALLDHWAKIYARFNEVLSGIVTVKSFAMEEAETRRFLKDVSVANQVVVKGVRDDSGFGAAQNLIVAAARVAAVGIGGLLVIQGNITAGTLLALLGYVGGLFGPVQGLSGVYKTLRVASVSLEQVFSILDAEDTQADVPGAQPLSQVEGHVSFEEVSFEYVKGIPSIHQVSFKVQAGQTVALVGPSGAGKTTLMALLLRLFEPTSGVIRIDGMDLRSLQQHSIRQQFGVVLQDPLLFNETIRDNIAYGRPGATDDEVEAAARAAHAHEFIRKLPKGYASPVGERGGRLSTGERQRIAIARALLKDPRMLILDEPTSALDVESESLVQDALRSLTRGRTTFAIAHRLSTVLDADRILVLEGGKLVETGTHEQLMATRGYYASLVHRQLVEPANAVGLLALASSGA